MPGSSNGGDWINAGLCIRMTEELNRIVGAAAPENKGFINGVVDYYQEQRRRNSILQSQIDTGDGKRNESSTSSALGKGVRITYWQREDPDDATVTMPEGCPTGEDTLKCEDDVAISRNVATKVLRVNEMEVRKLCNTGQSEYIARDMQRKLRAATKQLNVQLATLLAANIGTWRDGSAVQDFTLINAADGSVNALGESLMVEELLQNIFSGRPTVIGTNNWLHFRRHIAMGGLQDTGIQTNQMGIYDFHYDMDLVSLLTDTTNGGLILEDGTTAMLTANGYVGEYVVDGAEVKMGTIRDPETGLVWDLRANYDRCGNTMYENFWNIFANLNYDFWSMPADVYKAGDDLVNTNGVFEADANRV